MPPELDALLARYPGATTDEFGDSRALSARLISLVRAGRKTATCGALRDHVGEGRQPAAAGAYEIILDFDGVPALVLRLTEVEIRRFDQVDWAFARDEGEDDDLEGWRDGHARFFARNGGFAPDMELVCTRFELVEDLAGS